MLPIKAKQAHKLTHLRPCGCQCLALKNAALLLQGPSGVGSECMLPGHD